MKWKLTAALGFVGAVAVAATAFAQTPGPSASKGPSGPKAGGRGLAKLAKRVVHSESKVQMPDGTFALVILDQGDITAVDVAAKSVTIKRADGESVSVTAADATIVRRDGKKATLGDLKVGDHAAFIQIDKDGTKTVKGIRAFSKDFQPKGRGARGRFKQGGAPPPAVAPADFMPADFAA